MYSNYCCSSSFEPEIIRIGQSSHEMYSNNIVNFQESRVILNANTKKFWKLMHLVSCIYTCEHVYVYISLSNIYIYIYTHTPTQIDIHECVYMNACVYIYIYIYIYMYG